MRNQETEVINASRKSLPYGFYSRRHLNIFLSIFVFLAALSIFISIIMYKHNVLNHPLLYIFIELFLLLLAFLIAHCFGNPMLPILKKFYQTGNFNQFRRRTAHLLKFKLHPEISKEIILWTVLFLLDVNASEGVEIYRLIQKPRSKTNKYLYEIVSIKYNTIMGYYTPCEKLIEEYEKNHKKIDRQVLGNKVLVQIGKNNVTMKDIDNEFPTDTKNTYINVRNAYFLMRYYEYYSKIQEAKVYAKLVRDKGENFYELVDEAEEVLKIRVVKTQIETLAHGTDAVVDMQAVKDMSIEDLAVEKDEEQEILETEASENSEEVKEEKSELPDNIMEAIEAIEAKDAAEVQDESNDLEEESNEESNEESSEESSEQAE